MDGRRGARLTNPTPDQIAREASQLDEEATRQRRLATIRRQDTFAALVRTAGRRYEACQLATFIAETPTQQRAVSVVREYIDMSWPTDMGMVLVGPCGTGKDHLAFSICRGLLRKHGTHCEWINAQDWFGSIRDEIGKDNGLTEESQ